MRHVFADTFLFIALLNPADRAHQAALKATRVRQTRFITSDFVLVELLDGMASVRFRSMAADLVAQVRRDPAFFVVGSSDELRQRAEQLYRSRPDKAWSLTDCTSFVIMRDEGLEEALTGDAHFGQAGFRPLFLPTT